MAHCTLLLTGDLPSVPVLQHRSPQGETHLLFGFDQRKEHGADADNQQAVQQWDGLRPEHSLQERNIGNRELRSRDRDDAGPDNLGN